MFGINHQINKSLVDVQAHVCRLCHIDSQTTAPGTLTVSWGAFWKLSGSWDLPACQITVSRGRGWVAQSFFESVYLGLLNSMEFRPVKFQEKTVEWIRIGRGAGGEMNKYTQIFLQFRNSPQFPAFFPDNFCIFSAFFLHFPPFRDFSART